MFIILVDLKQTELYFLPNYTFLGIGLEVYAQLKTLCLYILMVANFECC